MFSVWFFFAIKFQKRDFDFVNLGKIQLFNYTRKSLLILLEDHCIIPRRTTVSLDGYSSVYTADQPEIQRVPEAGIQATKRELGLQLRSM